MARGGALIGALRVSLGIDSAQFEEGSKRSVRRAKQDANEMQRAYAAAATGIRRSLTVAAGAVASAGFLSAARDALDYAASLGEISAQVGVTVEQLQEYRYAASQVNLSTEEMEKALAKLTVSIGKAGAGSKKEVAAFRELDVSLRDGAGNMLNAAEIMPRIADGLAKIKDPAARARLEVELFGRAGQRLDPLLSQGAGAIENFRKQANDLGIVLSKDLSDSADKASDRLAEMKMILESNFSRIIAENADSVLGLANAFMKLTSETGAFIAQYPKLSGALAGATAGSRAGLPGAAVGAGLGMMVGGKLSQGATDANMDVKFRAQQLKGAVAEFRARTAAKRGGGLIGIRKESHSGSGGTIESAAAEMQRQADLLRLAQDQARMVPMRAPPMPGALPEISGGGGGKGKTPAKAKAERDRSAEYMERYDREMERLLADELDLRADMATDTRERAMYELKRIEIERVAYNADVDSRKHAGELTQLQAEELKLQRAANDEKVVALRLRRLDDDLAREEFELKRESLTIEQQILRSAAFDARTADERRRIELAILDHQYELERLALQKVIDAREANDEDKRAAQRRLGELDRMKGGERQNILRGTLGPLADYLDRMPQSAEELNEAYQRVAIDGLGSLNDALAEAMLGSKNLGDTFKNMSNAIIADLARIAIQQMIIKPLANSLLGMLGGGGGGGVNLASASANISAGLSAMRLPGLAGGGSFNVGGAPGTDQNVLAINGVPRVRVSANERINVTPANDRGGAVVQLVVGEGQIFEPRVQAISGQVSVQTVTAQSAAMGRMQKRRLGR